jgi:hypothetical protein
VPGKRSALRSSSPPAFFTMVVAKAGGLDIEYETNPDMAALKPILPFGQVRTRTEGCKGRRVKGQKSLCNAYGTIILLFHIY